MFRQLLIAAFMLLWLPTAVQAADPINCTGYSTPRVFVDDQSWWLRTPGQNGNDFGHAHVATCFPLFQHVSGVVPFDVKITVHNNPGEIKKLTIHVEGGNGGIYVLADKFFSPPLTCATTCDFWVSMNANTTVVPIDGFQRFTFRTIIKEPDGKEMHNANSWRAYLENGKPRNDSTPVTRTEGKGWYTGANYANSKIDNYSYGSAWSGTKSLKVICNASNTVTGCLVTIDPDFHSGNEGTVLLRTNGQFNGNVSLDTTKFSNGNHKLVIRTDVKHSSGSTLSGILGLPFTVQN